MIKSCDDITWNTYVQADQNPTEMSNYKDTHLPKKKKVEVL